MNNNAKQRLFIIILLVSVSFLSVIFGMVAHKFKLWPVSIFQDAYQATKAWRERLTPRDRYKSRFFAKARHVNSGVLQYDKAKAYDGFTLFTSVHAQKALLISMDGQILHEWHIPFSEIWENPPHIEFKIAEDFILWGKAHMYPNGDLVTTIGGFGDTPWGYGLVKMDKDSNLIWKYAEHAHHDVNVGSDDKIYTLIHDFTSEQIPGMKLKLPFLDDSIVVLSPDGHELNRVSISKAFSNSDFSSVLNVVEEKKNSWDPWHTNNVDILDEEMAKHFPFLKPGQVLVSMRNIDTLAAIDMDKKQVVWAVTGPWHMQHDPDFLKNGNILLFDNRGNFGTGGASRIIEFNPMTMEIVWQYAGNEQNIFSTGVKGVQQMLPNGNVLISESMRGRIFEVTREKEIVWEFSSPFRAPHDKKLVANVWGGERYHPDYLEFEVANKNIITHIPTN